MSPPVPFVVPIYSDKSVQRTQLAGRTQAKRILVYDFILRKKQVTGICQITITRKLDSFHQVSLLTLVRLKSFFSFTSRISFLSFHNKFSFHRLDFTVSKELNHSLLDFENVLVRDKPLCGVFRK